MKKIVLTILTVFIFTFFTQPAALSAAIEINSDNAIVFDVETGQILYGKNPYTLAPDGDFNKLLNIITALQFENAPKELVVTKNALVYNQEPPYLGLKEGQIVSLDEMLYAEYLGNYNDAANVVAENLGQTLLDTSSEEYQKLNDYKKTEAAIEAYVKEMNKTASKLHATTMKATNSDGHFYDTQQCSPLDLARLLQAGLRHETFAALFAADSHVINVSSENINTHQADYKDKKKKNEESTSAEVTASDESDGNDAETENNSDDDEDIYENDGGGDDDASVSESSTGGVPTTSAVKTTIKTTNPFLNGNILYSGVIGGYNGYNSNVEKYHMVVCARNDERTLIAVVMNGDENVLTDDIQALLNFGFYKWHKATIEQRDLDHLLSSRIAGGDLAFTGRFDVLIPDDYEIGDLDAAIAYTENGYLSGTVTLSLPEEVAYAGPITTISFYERNERTAGDVMLVILAILGAVIIMVVIVLLIRRYFGPGKNKARAFSARIRKTAKKEREKVKRRTSRSDGTGNKRRRGSKNTAQSGRSEDYHAGQKNRNETGFSSKADHSHRRPPRR